MLRAGLTVANDGGLTKTVGAATSTCRFGGLEGDGDALHSRGIEASAWAHRPGDHDVVDAAPIEAWAIMMPSSSRGGDGGLGVL